MIIDTSNGQKELYQGDIAYGKVDSSLGTFIESLHSMQIVIGDSDDECVNKLTDWALNEASVGPGESFKIFNIRLSEPIN